LKSPHSWRIALVVFGSALAGDALLARAARADAGGCSTVVHLQDFSKFQTCFGYPATAPPGVDCALFDFDGNGVVDLRDFTGRTFVLRARILVFPARVLITYSQRADFDAAVLESGNQSVTWSVRPVPGSEPGESLGTIDANGLYTPPSRSDLRAASEVIVEARSVVAPTGEFACVSLFGALAAPPPASLVLPGSGNSGGIPSNVTTAFSLVALVLPGPGDSTGSPANVTISRPPTALVLPGQGDPDGLPMNVTLAMPPVALVLPGAGDLDLAMNVTLAMPPVALVLPGVSEPDAFPPNTTVASPPVSVDFADPP
jgi:hypothetical protein